MALGDVTIPEAVVAAMGIRPFLLGDPRLTAPLKRRADDLVVIIQRGLFRAIRSEASDVGRGDGDEFNYKEVSKALIDTGDREQIKAFTDAFAGEHPDLTAGVQSEATRIIHYLIDQFRTVRKARLTVTGAIDGAPSDVQLQRFVRQWRIACDPLSIITALELDEISRDQVRALEALFPGVYGAIRKGVLLSISRIKARRPSWEPERAKDLQLRVLMQTDTIDPRLAADIAATAEPPPQQAQAPSRMPKQAGDGMGTAGQRLSGLGSK